MNGKFPAACFVHAREKFTHRVAGSPLGAAAARPGSFQSRRDLIYDAHSLAANQRCARRISAVTYDLCRAHRFPARRSDRTRNRFRSNCIGSGLLRRKKPIFTARRRRCRHVRGSATTTANSEKLFCQVRVAATSKRRTVSQSAFCIAVHCRGCRHGAVSIYRRRELVAAADEPDATAQTVFTRNAAYICTIS
jgi:hypothetical protein